ncbi:MAG: hypothetical protein WA001_02210, partial [Patescibacteria group bacterium]
MKTAFQPLLLYPCIIRKGQTTFRLPSADIDVRMPSSLATKLLMFADGTHTEGWVLKQICGRWSEQSVTRLLDSLKERRVLVDGRNISPIMWEFMRNPSAVAFDLPESDVTALVLDMELQ